MALPISRDNRSDTESEHSQEGSALGHEDPHKRERRGRDSSVQEIEAPRRGELDIVSGLHTFERANINIIRNRV